MRVDWIDGGCTPSNKYLGYEEVDEMNYMEDKKYNFALMSQSGSSVYVDEFVGSFLSWSNEIKVKARIKIWRFSQMSIPS
jgi:hypothetical protein